MVRVHVSVYAAGYMWKWTCVCSWLYVEVDMCMQLASWLYVEVDMVRVVVTRPHKLDECHTWWPGGTNCNSLEDVALKEGLEVRDLHHSGG